MPKPALDLTMHTFMRESKELTVFGTWIYDHEEEDHEPCLVLVKTNAVGTDKIVPCVVLLSEAWRYEDPGSGHWHLLMIARKFVKAMGLDDNMTNTHMVADAIHTHLLDLIKLPPRPTEQDTSRGAEAVIVGPDGKSMSLEMYEDK